MKILYVATISDTINNFLVPHIEMLKQYGCTVDLACNVQKEVDPRLIALGCKTHDISFERNPFHVNNYKAYQTLKKIMKEEEYDIVHTHTPVASVITRIVSRANLHTRVFYTAHGFHFYKGAPKRNWYTYYRIEKLLSHFTEKLITINEEDYKRAKKDFYAREVVHVPGVGLDLSRFKPANIQEKSEVRQKLGFKTNDFIVLSVGELNANKNQEMLIDTVRILGKAIPPLKVLIVGSGDLKDHYQQLIEEYALENHIELLGYRNDVDNLMAAADVVVSTSKREGLPVNIMEAMATGLSLVVTDTRGNRDLVKNGVNGYVVQIGQKREFSRRIKDLYYSPALRENFLKNNVRDIQQYSLEKALEQMRLLYNLEPEIVESEGRNWPMAS